VQKLSIQSDNIKNEDLENKFLQYRSDFIKAMDEDFNSPLALKVLFEMAKEVNMFIKNHKTINEDSLKKVVNTFRELGGIFCILQKEATMVDLRIVNDLVDLLAEIRQILRTRKDWQMSDMIRTRLRNHGIILEDEANGTRKK
jgi:cysteinyl-tRNA synthetase